MDYPQLNLLFGLILIFVLMLCIGSRVLLTKFELPVWMSVVSWTALVLSVLSTLYIEVLFLQSMTPAFNRQIGLGVLLIGGIGALVTASLYRREFSSRAAGILFVVQMIASLVSLWLAYGLYRSLVPVTGM
jgi:hypothetical protein